MDFNKLYIGCVIRNKRSGMKYKIYNQISENVFEMISEKYGSTDYINTNTVDDYELV